MKISIVSGTEMLKMCNESKEVWRVNQNNTYTLYEYLGQKLFIEGVHPDLEGKVVVVNKNADFTEGRGPMRFHKLFKTVPAAFDYIMAQDGIYGTKQGISNWAGVNVKGVPYVVSSFNGYNVEVAELEN